MTDEEAKDAQKELVDLGLANNKDDAAHMLVDAGEIDSSQHAELLSDKERERIYG
jgi:hypothetical protein